jgi:hypothetical protein
VAIPDLVRKQLSRAADITAFLVLPNGDKVVAYDTVSDQSNTADFMDNHPHVAIFRGDNLSLDVDSVSLATTGPIRFDGMASLPTTHGIPVLAVAFALGGDGAATFFVFIGPQHKKYRVLTTLQGEQAQLRFSKGSPKRLELWTANGYFSRDPDKQCIWCPKYYNRSTYAWRDGKLVRISTRRTTRGYQPETFDNDRFIIR